MTRIILVASPTKRRTICTTLIGALIGSVLLVTVACAGGDSSTGPRTPDTNTTTNTNNKSNNRNVAGAYVLATVNKKPIPFEIYRGPYYYKDIDYTFADLSITVTGGELDLQGDGQFR